MNLRCFWLYFAFVLYFSDKKEVVVLERFLRICLLSDSSWVFLFCFVYFKCRILKLFHELHLFIFQSNWGMKTVRFNPGRKVLGKMLVLITYCLIKELCNLKHFKAYNKNFFLKFFVIIKAMYCKVLTFMVLCIVASHLFLKKNYHLI